MDFPVPLIPPWTMPRNLNLTIDWGDGSTEAGIAGSRHQRGNDRQHPPLRRQRDVHHHADPDGFGRHHRSSQRQGHGRERRPHGDAEERRGRE